MNHGKRMFIVLILLVSQTKLSGQIPDPVTLVTGAAGEQGNPQAAYNFNDDQYLVVWEDCGSGPAAIMTTGAIRICTAGCPKNSP